uniref:Putative ovule protein n=1 Tax=Solanum chacoense TaxID=4108 RepID=A0A0V0HI54_SOLCH
MDNEINSRFQEERVIIESLIDSKLAAMKQRLGERIVQVIQELFSSLGIDYRKPAVHEGESSNALTIGRSTILTNKGYTLPIQLAGQNHQTCGNSNLTIPRYARMDFPT